MVTTVTAKTLRIFRSEIDEREGGAVVEATASLFSSYAGKEEFFSSYTGFRLKLGGQRVVMFLVGRASLISSYAGSHKTGTAQPSMHIDAQRLVLLDRAENGGNGHSEDSDIPFRSESVRSGAVG